MEDKINWGLIIHRLDTIVENQEKTDERLLGVEAKLSAIDNISYDVKSLKDWKKDVNEAASPSQLKEVWQWKNKMDDVINPVQLGEKIKDVEGLKTFKTQALMIWVLIQALMALALFWTKASD